MKAQLTRDTLKYMGTVKDTVLPSVDIVNKAKSSTASLRNDISDAYEQWKSDTLPILQALAASPHYGGVENVTRDMMKAYNAFFDTFEPMTDMLAQVAVYLDE